MVVLNSKITAPLALFETTNYTIGLRDLFHWCKGFKSTELQPKRKCAKDVYCRLLSAENYIKTLKIIVDVGIQILLNPRGGRVFHYDRPLLNQ